MVLNAIVSGTILHCLVKSSLSRKVVAKQITGRCIMHIVPAHNDRLAS